MWRLSFLPVDGHAWVDALPLGGCQMATEPFGNRHQAEQCASALRELWPDLRVLVCFVDED